MKHLSLVLNGVLIIAVGILFYLHFSSKKPVETKSKAVAASNVTGNMTRPAIAYVELDSLNEKIDFIRDKKKQLEAQQQRIESEYNSGSQGVENKKNAYINSKKGVTVSQEEAQQVQAQLMQEQQGVEEKRQTATQKLSEEHYKFMEDLQKKLRDFLEDYNKEKNYMYIFTTGTGLDYMAYKDSTMNITDDVVEGMNKKMNAAAKP